MQCWGAGAVVVGAHRVMAQGGVLDREGVLPLFQELEVQPCPALHEDPHLEAFLRQVIAEQHLEESFFVVDLGKVRKGVSF